MYQTRKCFFSLQNRNKVIWKKPKPPFCSVYKKSDVTNNLSLQRQSRFIIQILFAGVTWIVVGYISVIIVIEMASDIFRLGVKKPPPFCSQSTCKYPI